MASNVTQFIGVYKPEVELHGGPKPNTPDNEVKFKSAEKQSHILKTETTHLHCVSEKRH